MSLSVNPYWPAYWQFFFLMPQPTQPGMAATATVAGMDTTCHTVLGVLILIAMITFIFIAITTTIMAMIITTATATGMAHLPYTDARSGALMKLPQGLA